MLVDYSEYRYLLTVNISLRYNGFHQWVSFIYNYYINDVSYLSKDLVTGLMNDAYQYFIDKYWNEHNITFRASLPDKFIFEENNRRYRKEIHSQYGDYIGDINVMITEFSQIQNYFDN